ncbi:hypothetical protein ASD54_25320 [Rhizobium sp. Root149]|nr:hypothetical protein ASD54_25320 [Rhizobium sp. Root149]
MEEARRSIARIQDFDTETLPRRGELGSAMSFDAAVEPAQRLIRLFQQISLDHLGDLNDRSLTLLRDRANSLFSIFQSVLSFSPETDTAPTATRTQLIGQLKDSYDQYFTDLHPVIAYLASRQRDFAALEREARAAVQSATDQATELKDQLGKDREEAERILEKVRQVAAEQGVSQQAIYFREEAERHEADALNWRKYTIGTAIGLGLYAALTILIHKVPFLVPTTPYEAVQLALGKFLLFGVIAYMLLLCARNFLSHKHNAIVNKHRHNALLTFNALAEAASGEDRRDIVLTHAAACIFSPQDTGYTKHSSQSDNATTKLVEILPKLGGSSS